MDNWYYAQRNQKLGPYSFNRMKELAGTGVLQPSDMVLRVGEAKWVTAETIDGLFGKKEERPSTSRPSPEGWRQWIRLAAKTPAACLVAGFVVGSGLGFWIGRIGSTPELALQPKKPPEASERDLQAPKTSKLTAENYLKITDGMEMSAVRLILGRPTKNEVFDGNALNPATHGWEIWEEGKEDILRRKEVTINFEFKNGAFRVTSKHQIGLQ